MSTGKSKEDWAHKAIARSAGAISFATLISRILGFIRDVVIARVFGIYAYAQAFVIAFRIPNLFRDLVGEGAANAAFVPVFSEYAEKRSKEEFWELVNVMLNLLLVVLMAITLLGIIFSPLIVRLIAPGFAASADKLQITIRLNRIIFPYLLLIGLAAYSTAVLNSLKHFSVPAFAPCLLNISIIVCALIFGEGIKGLALGVLIGGVLQLGIQIPVLYKKGFRFRFPNKFKHPAAFTIGRLLTPRLFSSSIYQLNNFVDSIFGSLALIVGEGGVAVLYFSARLFQFPLGIFSNALTQAILPTFSTQALDEDKQGLVKSLSWGLRSTFFVLLPASAGLIALSLPIVKTLFAGGRFDANSARLTANALLFYSIGLCAYGSTKMLQSCFFALKDTLTPAKVSGIALVMNIILCSMLMFPLKIGGIALATSISGVVSSLILFYILKKRLVGLDIKELIRAFTRILLASACMAGVCFAAAQRFNLLVALIAGCVSYIIFCFIFRVREMQQLWDWIAKRKQE